jgi:hypothetical protein
MTAAGTAGAIVALALLARGASPTKQCPECGETVTGLPRVRNGAAMVFDDVEEAQELERHPSDLSPIVARPNGRVGRVKTVAFGRE